MIRIALLMIVLISNSGKAQAYPGWDKGNSENVTSAPMDSKMALASFQEYAAKINTQPIEKLPVLSNGRIKPIHSLARESILYITGSQKKFGLSPLQIYLAMATSKAVVDIELINVRSPQLREQLGFMKSKRFFTLRELEGSQLSEISQPLLQKEQENARSLTQNEKDILEAFNQTWLAQQIVSSAHLSRSVDLTGLSHGEGGESDAVANFLRALAENPQSGGAADAEKLIQVTRAKEVAPPFRRQLENLSLEVFYNKAHLFLIAAVLYLLLGGLMQIPASKKRCSPLFIGSAFAVPSLLQATGFAIRVYITGFAPVTNMYGTMLWVSLGVGLFSMVLYVLYRAYTLVGLLWMGSGLILLLTESLPLVLSPDMDPIVAVLRSNYWLTIHVLTITISYAAFTVAMLIGNTALIRLILGRHNRSFFQEYARYAYRMIQLGVFLLTVGIILGGIWADYSWGRFWGWDPKETWALIADLGYLVIMHARYIGWLDSFGVLAASPVAYLLVVMAWYGVNFILASGLHSYGFSSGGALAVLIFVSLQVILFAVAILLRRASKQPQIS